MKNLIKGIGCYFIVHSDFYFLFVFCRRDLTYKEKFYSYLDYKKRSYKDILKKCLIVFIILNIFGCILTTYYAEQNKQADYNHLITKSKLNLLYKTTNFKN